MYKCSKQIISLRIICRDFLVTLFAGYIDFPLIQQVSLNHLINLFFKSTDPFRTKASDVFVGELLNQTDLFKTDSFRKETLLSATTMAEWQNNLQKC